jgi:thioredoxin reductase
MTDSEYDVAVIGSGIAGLSAAPAANQRRYDACVPTDAFTSHAIPQHRITGRVCMAPNFLRCKLHLGTDPAHRDLCP